MAFDKNVFVNCPFDDAYLPLLQAGSLSLSSTSVWRRGSHSKFRFRPAAHRQDHLSDQRFEVRIHDLSRLQADKAGEYDRLNMPL